MIEHHHLLRTGSFLQQNLYFRIINFLYFLAIVKVAYRGLLMNEPKSLPVEGWFLSDAGIMD